VGSRDLLLNSATAYISQEWLQPQNPVRIVCSGFNPAFAKLLGLLFNLTSV